MKGSLSLVGAASIHGKVTQAHSFSNDELVVAVVNSPAELSFDVGDVRHLTETSMTSAWAGGASIAITESRSACAAI